MNLNKYEVIRFLIKNKKIVDLGFNLAKGLKEFSTNKSYFSLIENGFNFIKESYINNITYTSDFLKEKDGWFFIQSKYGKFPAELFYDLIEKYESVTLEARYDSNSCKVYNLPIAQIACLKYPSGDMVLYFKKTKNISAQNIIDFLVKEKIRQLNCFVFSLTVEKINNLIKFNLREEELRNLYSKTAHNYIDRLNLASSYDICRSILFYGPPGTGKTTIMHNIIKKLGYKTLIINFNEIINYDIVYFLIDSFNIEAVIIDDFDLTDGSARILKFLEDIRNKVKVILASANSLSAIYPPLMRPGRFDEISKIDSLNKETILGVLGDLNNIFEKVNHWPIAFIKELVIRNKLDPSSLDKDILELDERCFKQLEMK